VIYVYDINAKVEVRDMWVEGKINGFDYFVKHYKEGSMFGIKEGKISKLLIRKELKTLVNYDRGWDVEPKETEVMAVYEKLLEMYN
jgi:hypothetical protein